MSKKKKRQRTPHQNSVDSLKRQMQANGLLGKYLPATGKAKDRKISEVFLEFIAPFQATTNSRASFEKLIVAGMIAWNAALVTGFDRQKMITGFVQSIVDQAGETWRKDTEDVLAMLIEHKERSFAADRRVVVDYRVTDTGTAYHLAMAALE